MVDFACHRQRSRACHRPTTYLLRNGRTYHGQRSHLSQTTIAATLYLDYLEIYHIHRSYTLTKMLPVTHQLRIRLKQDAIPAIVSRIKGIAKS